MEAARLSTTGNEGSGAVKFDEKERGGGGRISKGNKCETTHTGILGPASKGTCQVRTS